MGSRDFIELHIISDLYHSAVNSDGPQCIGYVDVPTPEYQVQTPIVGTRWCATPTTLETEVKCLVYIPVTAEVHITSHKFHEF